MTEPESNEDKSVSVGEPNSVAEATKPESDEGKAWKAIAQKSEAST